jgi:prolyl-tRNA editing enzyme YbaK/EbsC (Cys-tRNA(Pro) deacylase)
MTSSDAAADPAAAAIAQLDELGLTYEVMECDPELADTAAFCEHYGVPLDRSGNCIIVATKREPKQFCACLVLSNVRLDVNKTVKGLLGARCSFAAPEETMELTGMMIGGVTPFGLPSDLPLYVDAPIEELDYLVVGGGSRSQKLKVPPAAITALPNAELIEGLSLGER